MEWGHKTKHTQTRTHTPIHDQTYKHTWVQIQVGMYKTHTYKNKPGDKHRQHAKERMERQIEETNWADEETELTVKKEAIQDKQNMQ